MITMPLATPSQVTVGEERQPLELDRIYTVATRYYISSVRLFGGEEGGGKILSGDEFSNPLKCAALPSF